jgi:hypothetical protein
MIIIDKNILVGFLFGVAATVIGILLFYMLKMELTIHIKKELGYYDKKHEEVEKSFF